MNSTRRCKDTFCPKFVSRQKKMVRNITMKFARKGDNKKLLENSVNKIINTKKFNKKTLEACVKGYCNPSCKDTVFEAGSKIPASLEKVIKKKKAGKELLKIINTTRKHIFGKKKNVLADSFYEKLSKASVNKLKKEGAISGCTMAVLD